jgi:hypothetical protein
VCSNSVDVSHGEKGAIEYWKIAKENYDLRRTDANRRLLLLFKRVAGMVGWLVGWLVG